MSGRSLRVSLETLLWVSLFVLGAGLRLACLDQLPLTDAEATQALRAAAEGPGASAFWNEAGASGPVSAAYHTLTSLLFQVVPLTNGAARAIPALAGSTLVLVPFVARRRLGRGPALATSFLLAVSPLMVTAHRTADGISVATVGVLLAMALFLGRHGETSQRPRMIGLAGAAALALVSGPSVFGGLLGLGLGLLAARLLWRAQPGLGHFKGEPGHARTALWIGLAVLVLLATGFGLLPDAISALPESLATWLVGWGHPGPVNPLTPLAALLLYEPLVLVFGGVGAFLALRERDALGRMALGWALGALLVGLAYPSRQTADLVWAILPLCYLGGRALASVAERVAGGWSWQAHVGLVLVLAVLAAIAYFQLAGYSIGRGPGIYVDERELSLAVAAVVVILGAVLIILYGLGWGWAPAVGAAGIAGAVGLFLASLSALWHLNFAPSAFTASELWSDHVYGHGLPLLIHTLEGISQAHTGRTDAIPIEIQGEVPAGLAWALRAYPRAAADSTEAPAIVLAPAGVDPSGLQADYLGQQIGIGERHAWTGLLPPDPVSWFIRRASPAIPDEWFLLVREDIATLGSVSGQAAPAP